MSVVSAGADRLLQEVRDRRCRGSEISPLDCIDTECHELRQAIVERMRQGVKTTVEDVVMLDEKIGAARLEKMTRELAKGQRCLAHSDELKLFRVENRAGKSIKIAAIDPDCARIFATHSRHVHEAKNAKVFVYKDEWLEGQRKSGSAIGRALKAGFPGVLKEVGNHVLIEARKKVYSPLSTVSSPDPRFSNK